MIEHLVLFKLRGGVSAERERAFLEALRGLRDSVPEVRELTAGINFSARSRGYTHGLRVLFQDRAALERYQAHPAHLAVVGDHVKPLAEDVLALDYEFP